MTSTTLRNEALLMLEGKGTILDVARRVSNTLIGRGIDAAVIGGIAVVLHQHLRTTRDIDIWVPGPLQVVANCLQEAGATFDSARRELIMNQVPIHLVTIDPTAFAPTHLVEIERIRTVSLGDLISMKLSSGMGNMLRHQDLADVTGLIRANNLTGTFTPKIAKPFRKDFRQFLKAVANEG